MRQTLMLAGVLLVGCVGDSAPIVTDGGTDATVQSGDVTNVEAYLKTKYSL